MPRIKLEGVAQPFGAISKGIKSGVATVHSGVVTGVAAVATTGAAVATTGATAVNSGLNTGFTGVFSLGKGFRDFILRGMLLPHHHCSEHGILLHPDTNRLPGGTRTAPTL
jgi:hypothetical protein